VPREEFSRTAQAALAVAQASALAAGKTSFLRGCRSVRRLTSYRIEGANTEADKPNRTVVFIDLDDAPTYALAADVEPKRVSHADHPQTSMAGQIAE